MADIRVIRQREVTAKTGLGRSSIYYAMAHHDFPKPVKLGLKAAGWIESEIDRWIEVRAAERGPGEPGAAA